MLALTFFISFNLLRPLLSAPVDCDLAFSCLNLTTDAMKHSSLYIYGYKSHSGSLSTLNSDDQNVVCRGAFSCADAASITAGNGVSCDGTNACVRAGFIYAASYVGGDGINALTSAIISNTPTIQCNGEQSCAYSTIQGSTLIEAYGAYSVLNAVIDSINGTGTLDINLFGYYSGFGSNITCRTGDYCTINCAANGCTNVHLNCDNNCIINYTSPDTVRAINHSWINIDSILLYDAANISNTLDKECSAQNDTMNYDDNREAPIGDITASGGGPICCRAHFSCFDTINIEYTSPIGAPIVSSGYRSFYKTNIRSKGAIFCDAQLSCDGTNINTTGRVYCTGNRACYRSNMVTAERVYCSGYEGCYDGSFISDGNDMDVYLLGHRSGYSVNITCTASDACSIWCYGYKSCENMTLVCDGICNLYCDADSLCPDGWNATVERPTTATTAPTAKGTTSYTSTLLNPSSTPSEEPTSYPPLTPSSMRSGAPTSYSTLIPSPIPTEDPTSSPSLMASNDLTTSTELKPTNLTTLPLLTNMTTNDVTTKIPYIVPTIQSSTLNTTPSIMSYQSQSPTVGYNEAEVDVVTTNQISTSQRSSPDAKGDDVWVIWVLIVLSVCIILILCGGIDVWFKSKKKKQMSDEANMSMMMSNKETEDVTDPTFSRKPSVELADVTVNTKKVSDDSVVDIEQRCEGSNTKAIDAVTDEGNSVAITPSPMKDTPDHDIDSLNSTYVTPMSLKRKVHKDALDVQYWLENVVKLPQYFGHFMSSGYEGMDFVKEIPNMMELCEIGIESKEHQQKIFEEIKKLKTEQIVEEIKKLKTEQMGENTTVEGE